MTKHYNKEWIQMIKITGRDLTTTLPSISINQKFEMENASK